MEYIFHTFHSFTAIFQFTDIAYNQSETVTILPQELFDVFKLSGGEIIQTNHPMPFLQQMLTQIRTDKSGSSGYQYFIHNLIFFTSSFSLPPPLFRRNFSPPLRFSYPLLLLYFLFRTTFTLFFRLLSSICNFPRLFVAGRFPSYSFGPIAPQVTFPPSKYSLGIFQFIAGT